MTVVEAADDERTRLLERIRANPEDDGPRLGLAELLTQRGDPRGRFIDLQVQYAKQPELNVKVRMNVLQRDHGAAWLPPGVRAESAVFRRGFLVDAEWVSATDPSHPEWALLEVLRCPDISEGDASPLAVARPQLRELHRATQDLLDELLRAPPVGLRELDVALPLGRFLHRTPEELSVFSRLDSLAVRPRERRFDMAALVEVVPVTRDEAVRILTVWRHLRRLRVPPLAVGLKAMLELRRSLAPGLTLEVDWLSRLGRHGRGGLRIVAGPEGVRVWSVDAADTEEIAFKALRDAGVRSVVLEHPWAAVKEREWKVRAFLRERRQYQRWLEAQRRDAGE